MEKFLSKSLFFFAAFTFFAFTRVNAQSITIQNFSTGIYTPGSSIGVPFNIGNSASCIAQTNVFQLYLANASGTILSATPIGTIAGFYGTFVNGVIPANTAPGTYTVVVKCTNPAITSAPSVTFTVVSGAAVTAAISGPSISSTYPNVFGNCNGGASSPFSFNNSSTPATATANFFNEATQKSEGSLPLTNTTTTTFTATGTNYTVIVSTTNGISVATQAYLLINNVVHNGLPTSGSNTFCYTTGQGASVTFPIDVTSPSGLQYNFPGNLYLATWGDGTTSTYTICQLINSGQISHTYTSGSCGHVANGLNNVFEVDFQPENTYCGLIGTRSSSDAKVIKAPVNSFSVPASSCSNAAITFTNTSDPGEDATSNSSNCVNTNALYTWSVDNVTKLANAPLNKKFSYTFTTNGTHTVTLTLQSNSNGVACQSMPVSKTICIQNPPKPAFTVPSTICSSSTVTPIDNSVVDPGCSAANNYLWTVTGPAAVSYAGGTNNTSKQPQFVFPQAGNYQITLSISSTTCGIFSTAPQTITVDDAPAISLSPDVSICGINQTYNFNQNPGPTQTTITGTPQSQAGAYTWTVTGDPNYTFANGTTANSQYPSITFNDYGKFTVTVTETNLCGTSTKSQSITFQQAPSVTINPVPNICPGSTVNLTGIIIDPNNSVTSVQWVGAGAFSNSTSTTTMYTPTADEIAAGSATVTLNVLTSLTGQCANIPVLKTINIFPVNNITSAAMAKVCTGTAVNYNITSTVPGSTFSWTAVLTSGNATGFNSGSGSAINDVIINNDPVNTAVITYTITPQANNCTGTPFTFTVSVDANSVVTATPANSPVCSGSPAGINLTANITGTTYTWTSSVTGSITGNSQQSTAIATGTINDVLTNSGTNSGTVTYTITPYNGNCPGAPVPVTITVQPLPLTSNPGVNAEICNQTTYPFNANDPSPGTGMWTVTSGPTGAVFDFPTHSNAIVSNLVPGNTYVFTWTITSPGCQSSSNSVTIIDDAPSQGGTTAGSTTICGGINTGSISLTGQTGNIIGWESSTDGVTWQPIAYTSQPLTYNNLTSTTQYRAVVQNGSCSVAYSNATTIYVNPPPTTSNAGSNQELCNSTSTTLQANPATSGTGLWTLASGQSGVVFDSTNPVTQVTGLVPGNTYQFIWTITTTAPCPPSASSVFIKMDIPTRGGTTSGTTSVCSGGNGGNITLSGQLGSILSWQSSTDNGTTWQIIADTTQTLAYSNLTATTQYRAVVQNGICAIMYSSISTITVNPAVVQANAGPNDEVCNTTVYTLQGNNPGAYPGLWTVASGQTGITFSNAANDTTTVSGLIPGNTYQFTWTITPAVPCTPTTSTVTIKDDPSTAGGVTTGTTSVCAGSNAGTISLSSQVGSIINWQSSIDTGATWQSVADTATTLAYTNLIQTTQYRAVMQSGICSVQYSSITKITVNQPVMQANAGGNQNLCGATSITLQGNSPLPFTGTWTQTGGPSANIVSPNNAATQVTNVVPGNNYTFLWTINAQAPCSNSTDTAKIFDAINAMAKFTADKTDGCGNYTVNFTNTSSTINGVSFSWDFGDGSLPSTAVNPSHTFSQRSNGLDTTYTVTLTVINNCAPTTPYTLNVTVRPQNPVAAILPTLTGCSPFAINVKNTSPGNNVSYSFFLYNGSVLVQQINKTDKSTAVFNPVSATDTPVVYTVYMVATGFCNNTTESNQIPITISPPSITAQMFLEGNVNSGCAPLNITFVNNTEGGQNFLYTIYDTSNQVVAQLTASTSNLPYTFNNAGTYYVTLTATNDCYTSVSPKTRIDVYSVPQPQFSADSTKACKTLTVNFTNLTPDNSTSSASSLSYKWDFGDFSQSFLQNPPAHTYTYKNSPYTVSLTATDPVSGCSSTITKTNLINVISPPGTNFTEKPDSITSIPNYTFSFIDQTTGSPASWYWTFGDGKTSTNENPDHTYPDTGLYKVTLTTSFAAGCDSTVTQNVRITGVPGQLFLPNAFEPTSGTSELKIFMAKGSGIKQWHMQIFNNYSELVWETTKLNEKGAPVDGWDGTYKGAPAPQGVYVWQVSATFINGTEWKGNVIKNSLPKRVGTINLIR